MKEKSLGPWPVTSRFRGDPQTKGESTMHLRRMERCESISRGPRGTMAKDQRNQKKKSSDLAPQKLIFVLEGTDSMEIVCRRMKERLEQV